MTVKELTERYYDKVIIYTENEFDMFDYVDLYRGLAEDIPDSILNMEVKNFGAKKYKVIDISVLNRI